MGVGPGLSASFASAAAAGQRLYPLDLFACLLVEDGVGEVDVPVQARVRVVLAFGRCVEGIASRRYSVLVHRVPPVGPRLRGAPNLPRGLLTLSTIVLSHVFQE